MVLGYHVIFSAYGFWLPNDPRGSWSDFVRSWELRRFGPASKVDTRRSVANRSHDRTLRQAAKQALRYPPVCFNGLHAQAVGNGFAQFVERSGLVIWACSILPEHVHMVIARHSYNVEQAVILLKGEATRQLVDVGIHPHAGLKKANGRVPGCWSRHLWKVFLDGEEAIVRAIQYVEQNPLKEGKPRQSWKFVTPYQFSGELQAAGRPPRSPSAPR
jgi:REP element-mobilizing transposase RayT